MMFFISVLFCTGMSLITGMRGRRALVWAAEEVFHCMNRPESSSSDIDNT